MALPSWPRWPIQVELSADSITTLDILANELELDGEISLYNNLDRVDSLILELLDSAIAEPEGD